MPSWPCTSSLTLPTAITVTSGSISSNANVYVPGFRVTSERASAEDHVAANAGVQGHDGVVGHALPARAGDDALARELGQGDGRVLRERAEHTATVPLEHAGQRGLALDRRAMPEETVARRERGARQPGVVADRERAGVEVGRDESAIARREALARQKTGGARGTYSGLPAPSMLHVATPGLVCTVTVATVAVVDDVRLAARAVGLGAAGDAPSPTRGIAAAITRAEIEHGQPALVRVGSSWSG